MSAIEKLKASATAKNLRLAAERQTHTMAVGGAGLALGMYEGSGRTLPSLIKGVDPKLQLGLAAAFLADKTSGTARTVARASADLLIGIGTYNLGRQYAGKSLPEAVSGVGDEVIDV